eukprot:TRINITY_DN3609_c0_g1_i3.p1 TRINITY_DN3609_c0_g1~~TRINITY_DN3609_c0_g1_i3.p1  ORF type:complete len:178 (+),score=27.56 TRINITY_DN3609_c0_g1_i3:772-1305(+)
MSTKYSAQTPYCFGSGFPVLNVRAALRQTITQVLSHNQPKKLLYSAHCRRFGAVITSSAFIAIGCDSGIAVNASDMNTLMIYLLSRPSVLKEEMFFSLCLPGIADDGFLHFYCRFVAPELGVLFAGIHKEDREDYAEKAMLIGERFKEIKFVESIERSVKEQYNPLSKLLPSSTCVF